MTSRCMVVRLRALARYFYYLYDKYKLTIEMDQSIAILILFIWG
jgi:hypothetical protein